MEMKDSYKTKGEYQDYVTNINYMIHSLTSTAKNVKQTRKSEDHIEYITISAHITL